MPATAKRAYDELAADQVNTTAPRAKKAKKGPKARPEQGNDLPPGSKARYAKRSTEKKNPQLLRKIKDLSQQLQEAREKVKTLPTRQAWREIQYENLRVKRENADMKHVLQVFNEPEPGNPTVSTYTEFIPGSAQNPYTASNRYRFPSQRDGAAEPMTLPEWAQPTGIPLGRKLGQEPYEFGDAYAQFSCDRQLLCGFQETLHDDDANFDEYMWR